MDQKKQQVLRTLEQALGVVTTACRSAGISRDTFYRWKQEDEDFARQVQDINEIAIDFAESQLHQQIKDGNTSATIFYLKSKAKQRGYVERQEITGADGNKVDVTIEVLRNGDQPKD